MLGLVVIYPPKRNYGFFFKSSLHAERCTDNFQRAVWKVWLNKGFPTVCCGWAGSSLLQVGMWS